jgi:chorismate mutase
MCEDDKHGFVSKVRDFVENKTVSIPWSCSMASPAVRFQRVHTTIYENAGVKEDAETEEAVALMMFENGETILDVKAKYEPVVVALHEAVAELNPVEAGSGIGGAIFFLAIILALVLFFIRRRRKNRKTVAGPKVERVEIKVKSFKQLQFEAMLEEGLQNFVNSNKSFQSRQVEQVLPAITDDQSFQSTFPADSQQAVSGAEQEATEAMAELEVPSAPIDDIWVNMGSDQD